MNGRLFAAAPVLAWNLAADLPPTNDMPAATEPCSGCWHGDSGPCCPYLGAVYNHSLPLTAYRVQPGCMHHLTQFWPPTPPPDGCGSHMYFGPPVVRHPENFPSCIPSTFQNLGQYSNFLESSKEQNDSLFKCPNPASSNSRVQSWSPGSKSDSVNNFPVNPYPYSSIKSEPGTELPNCHASAEKSRGSSHSSPSITPTYPVKKEPHTSTQDSNHSGKSMRQPYPDTSRTSHLTHPVKLEEHTSPQDSRHGWKAFRQPYLNAPHTNTQFAHSMGGNTHSLPVQNLHKQPETSTKDRHALAASKAPSRDAVAGTSTHLRMERKCLDVYQTDTARVHAPHPSSFRKDGMGTRDGAFYKEHSSMFVSRLYQVKREDNQNRDCQFQNNDLKSRPGFQGSEIRPSERFNVPTSIVQHKIEPSDRYSSCSSLMPNKNSSLCATTGRSLVARDMSLDLRVGFDYQNPVHFKSPFSKDSNQMHSGSYNSHEAAKPYPHQHVPHITSAFSERRVPFAPTESRSLGIQEKTKSTITSHIPDRKPHCTSDSDDEVEIIGMTRKTTDSGRPNPSNMSNVARSSLPSSMSYSSKPNTDATRDQYKKLKPVISSSQSKLCTGTSSKSREDSGLKKIPVINQRDTQSIQSPKSLTIPQEIVIEDDNLSLNAGSDAQTRNSVKSPKDVATQQEIIIEDDNLNSHELAESQIKNSSSKSLLKDRRRHETIIKDNRNMAGISEVQKNNTENDSLRVDQVSAVQRRHLPSNSDVINHRIVDANSVHDQGDCSKPVYDANHGLNLLFNTLEKVVLNQSETLTKSSVPDDKKTDSANPVEDPQESNKSEPFPRGLDLLSAIAEQRLVSEFDAVKQQENRAVCSHQPESSFTDTYLTTGLLNGMEELKKKYKQKQKEMSRLKPKNRLSKVTNKEKSKLPRKRGRPPTCSRDRSNSPDTTAHMCQDTKKNPGAKVRQKVTPPKKKRKVSLDASTSEKSDDAQSPCKRITRKSLQNDSVCISDPSKNVNKKYPRKAASELKKTQDRFQNDDLNLEREGSCPTGCLPENDKIETSEDKIATISRAMSSKRKSDHPKKYIPSKQSKLSETIVSKHLRSRILFDTSGTTSDDEISKESISRKVHDGSKKLDLSIERKKLQESLNRPELKDLASLGDPEPSLLRPEHLVVNQRLLALDDGLFYAGSIEECRSSKQYRIVLDGQRGNRFYNYSREELLSQAIVESKLLTPELPEGTRVCAYWSQQYHRLYPGVVGKAPAPSADWSEPRIFILFDDGDSDQIPAKNVRLIPPDMIIENSNGSDSENSNMGSSKSLSPDKNHPDEHNHSLTRRLEMKQKNSGATHNNESSCDESSCDSSINVDVLTHIDQRSRSPSKERTAITERRSESKLKHRKKHRKHHHRHHHHRLAKRWKHTRTGPQSDNGLCKRLRKRRSTSKSTREGLSEKRLRRKRPNASYVE